jgi:Protein of unknown function (DUF3097)
VSRGVLGGPVDGPRRIAAQFPDVEATAGLAVVHRGSRYRGRVLRVSNHEVELQGETGLVRVFPLTPGSFSVDGVACNLARPRRAPAEPKATASGSRALSGAKARVARAARIVVEGVHDAELIEKVWGDDLRVEGVVVERLDGLDHLPDYVDDFQPGPARRLGVLADHLVTGSKESRIAERIASPHVLITGTPYVDVWAAVRPKLIGIEAWPTVPKGTDWKLGVCAALGHHDARTFWRDLLARVTSYADLEVEVVGAVERLIDFVTSEP